MLHVIKVSFIDTGKKVDHDNNFWELKEITRSESDPDLEPLVEQISEWQMNQ